MARKVKHVGFKGAVRSCMVYARKVKGFSKERARRYCAGGVANASRNASAAAKRRNPRLKRVKG